MTQPRNPYGARPGGGITLPDYFRPTPSCTSNNFAPPNEPLAAGEDFDVPGNRLVGARPVPEIRAVGEPVGALDAAGVDGRKQSRSRYGTKKES